MRRNSMAGMVLAASMLAGCSTTGPFGREQLALPVGPSYVGGRGMQVFPTSTTLIANVKDAMSDVGIHAIIQTEDPGGLIILEGKTADDRKARVTIQTSGPARPSRPRSAGSATSRSPGPCSTASAPGRGPSSPPPPVEAEPTTDPSHDPLAATPSPTRPCSATRSTPGTTRRSSPD